MQGAWNSDDLRLLAGGLWYAVGRTALGNDIEVVFGLQDGAKTFADHLVIVDERAWKALDDGAKTSLKNATRSGLVLLLRVTGAVADTVAALGFDTEVL